MKYSQSDLINARRYAHDSREDLLRCTLCGCYNCTNIFFVSAVCEWKDSENGKYLDQRGICPFCGKDTLLGEDAGYPLKKDFLSALKKFKYI